MIKDLVGALVDQNYVEMSRLLTPGVVNSGDEEVEEILEEIVEDKGTTPEVLNKLAKSTNYSIRIGVAKHRNTSPKTLGALAYDEDVRVRNRVAVNPHTPMEQRLKLLDDPSNIVVVNSLYNPYLTLDIVRYIVSRYSENSQIENLSQILKVYRPQSGLDTSPDIIDYIDDKMIRVLKEKHLQNMQKQVNGLSFDNKLSSGIYQTTNQDLELLQRLKGHLK